ncbi:sigma 54-interacting transcriptional regulator [Agathobaculum sp. Marseille-P7918]|uniref:sigma 54-interacting transcriptional regulator n=1 Tax=Agathobaculum sp. Marseille-P7918 TaxID=2479843 RepID=UPI000F63BC30|nr:sigma 54-interacting transcriptional regulator [Agathobaculum sp. Marseille-P7918]
MIRIVFLAPFEELKELAEQVFAEGTENDRASKTSGRHYEFCAMLAPTTVQALSLDLNADVIIARGATAFDLKRQGFPVPVVELVISGEDTLNVLYLLKERYGETPAGIIGSVNMILGIEDTAQKIGVNLTPYYLEENTDEEIYRVVSRAVEDGKKIILGGMRGCTYAHNLGAAHLLLTSGRSSIWNAINAAKQLGASSREVQEHSLLRSAMVDNAFEGLIALDPQNNITAMNRSAQTILGLAPGNWFLGMPIREVLRSPQIVRLINRPDNYIDEIIEYHQTHLSFKKITIYLRDEVVGYVLTFLNANQIQEAEGKLRGKIYHKGHTAKYTFDTIIGESPAIRECVRRANAYAQTNSNIVIFGESGTGKELFSQSIHNASARREQPFVAVNCAAIPENLLESELFGYVGGAFTGASKEGKPGLFELAHNGTIFLDEISEMPLALQSRLLRVIQEREIMRIGHDKVIPIDVRVIAASNRNLYEQVRKGLFREDLYYRLDVLDLTIPPLRQRGHDISLLAHAFLNEFGIAQNRTPLRLTDAAARCLEQQPWQGNIRELRNFCERLSVLCSDRDLLDADDLPAFLPNHAAFVAAPAAAPAPAGELLPDNDLDRILAALEAAGGNKTAAAQALGMSRVTLWRQLKKLEEEQPPKR